MQVENERERDRDRDRQSDKQRGRKIKKRFLKRLRDMRSSEYSLKEG